MTASSDLTGLEPESAALVREMRSTAPLDWSLDEIENSRALIREFYRACFSSTPPEGLDTQYLSVPTTGGRSTPIQTIARQALPEDAPVALFLHGGGWISGDLESFEPVVSRLAAIASTRLISVGYSLAPEAKFPIALHECLDVLRWTINNLGDSVSVVGDSAGGNLAAALSLLARDAGIRIERQVLICPVIDPANFSYSSRQRYGNGDFVLSCDDLRQMIAHYASADADVENPYFSPAAAESLAGVAPATIITAEYDMLRDEGATYAERLQRDGVSVDYHMFPRTIHDFAVFGDAISLSDDAMRVVARALS